jgi:hypothetical protein
MRLLYSSPPSDFGNKLNTLRARQSASRKERKEMYMPLPVAVSIDKKLGYLHFDTDSMVQDIRYSLARILPGFLFRICMPNTKYLSFIDIAILSQAVTNKKIDIIRVN